MLRYIQNSDSKNAVDEATREIDTYVKKVKNLPEVEAGYMTLGDWIDGIVEDAKRDMEEEVRREVTEKVKEEVTKEITEEVRNKVTEEVTNKVTEEVTNKITEEMTEQSIKAVIEIYQEYHDTKENAVMKLRGKFPDYANQAEVLVERYWKEN